MNRLPLSRRGQLKAYIEPLAPLGYNPEMILSRRGASSWLHGPSSDWVPVQLLGETMDAAARNVGDNHYGFWIAEQGSIEDIQSIGGSLATAVNLYEALNKCAKAIKLLNTGIHCWLAEDDTDAWFCKSEPRVLETGQEFVEQYAVSKMVQLVRTALGPDWLPKQIHLISRSAGHFADWEAFGDAALKFGQHCSAIAIPRSLLNTPVRAKARSAHCQYDLGGNGERQSGTFAESLRLLIGSHLFEGALNVEQAAEIVGVSSRSLKRWLAKEGLTYREIVNQARYIRAKRLLKDENIPIREIAHELGYANAPHFWRAFRIWSGVSPGEFRRFSQEHPAGWPMAARSDKRTPLKNC